jgi:glutamyl-tRNA synthetase
MVRVRFAPSPTGALHIGGVRTALYNYLFARKNGGKMLLRIEDTDQKRFVPGAEDYIIESLKWVGIEIDEGQSVGGPHGPYRQSERTDIYKKYVNDLIEKGHAYYAFDTDEELTAMKERLKNAGVASPSYNAISRTQMRNSLTLPEDEVKALLAAGTPYVIRIKIPRKEEIRFNDIIRSWVMVHSSTLDDKVLMKSNGIPTYHLANVVDDHLMEITHVIRGEEWLPSAPLHVLLYCYLGWEDTMPKFAHLPLILKPDVTDEKGHIIEVQHGKLSKRDADKMGFPIFPLNWTSKVTASEKSHDEDEHHDEEDNHASHQEGEEVTSIGYREAGYLPEALVNFLAFLGWNPGTSQELFTMDELIDAFSLERVGKSGVKFNITKAKWYNQQYLRQKPETELAGDFIEALKEKNIACSPEKAEKVIHLLKERAEFPKDFVRDSNFFFNTPVGYDEKIASEKWTAEAANIISQFKDALPEVHDFSHDHIKATLMAVLEKNGIKIGKVMQALRLAVTGVGVGPDLMFTMEIIGQQETILRLENALQTLGSGI